jgi:hypothetical protein
MMTIPHTTYRSNLNRLRADDDKIVEGKKNAFSEDVQTLL